MIYTPRLSAPSVNDKNYINTSYGGYNKCIARDGRGNVLPNCTATLLAKTDKAATIYRFIKVTNVSGDASIQNVATAYTT